jgi:hypothetical protein
MQSYYIEVAQGGVLGKQYTIDCEYLAYFLPKKFFEKYKKTFFLEILCTKATKS